MAENKKRVAVIGAGMVGDRHRKLAVARRARGHADRPGAARQRRIVRQCGLLQPSSIVPIAVPGTLRKVPGYLADPLGPLRIRWSYLPALAPWLIRYIRAGTPARIEAPGGGAEAAARAVPGDVHGAGARCRGASASSRATAS